MFAFIQSVILFAHFIGFEVFTVVAIENIIFCDMAQCNLVEVY
jgi:hypothetical protein